MQRFINDPEQIVDDMLEGYLRANRKWVTRSKNNHRVLKFVNAPISGKVGIVTGGGSGHEPAFLGYVGKNMVDAVAVGEVFASPPAQTFYDAILEAHAGKGVACLFGNYAGDTMNVNIAIQMAEDEGIPVKYVVANDDIASSPKETREKRHGIAGGPFMWKVGGARAALGGSLDEVIASAQKAVNHTRSICVGLSSLTIPAVGSPNFHLEDGMMEFGIGHHGEAGIRVEKLKTAKEIAKEMTQQILEDFSFETQQRLAVLVSGLGCTPLMEQYVLYQTIEQTLVQEGHTVEKVWIGDYVTSLDMNGVSLTIMHLDEELDELLDYPAESVGFQVGVTSKDW